MEILKKYPKVKYLIFFIVMFISICTFVYVDSYRSEAYKFTKNYLFTNESIAEEYGKIQSVKLMPFGISIKERGLFGTASFKIEIHSVNGQNTLNVKLKKIDGRWSLESLE